MNRKIRNIVAILSLALSTTLAAQQNIDKAALEDAFAKLPQLEYGQDRAPFAVIDKATAASHNDESLRSELEKRFIGILRGDASIAAKDFACRALRLIGTEESVPALAALLPNEELSGLARLALEQIPGAVVDQALRDGLEQTSGRLKLGIISSLGFRRDPNSVRPLVGLLKDVDAATAGAAAIALAKIATPRAARALTEFCAQAPETIQAEANQAYLEAADNLLRQGKRRLAADMFAQILKDNPTGSLHLAGFQGLVAARPAESNSQLLDALAGSDAQLRNLAARLVGELPGQKTPKVFLDALPELPAESQVALLAALRLRGDSSAKSVVRSLLGNPQTEVSIAAIETLAAVGTGADALALARLAASGRPGVNDAARNGLAVLEAQDATESIVAALAGAYAPVRVELLRSLSARDAKEAAGAVTKHLGDANDQVSRAAIEALGNIGSEPQIPALVRCLLAAKTSQQREAIADAIGSVCARVREKASDSLLAGLRAGDPTNRAILLRVLSIVGGAKALEAVRTAAQDANAQFKDAAIRTLAEWPDSAAAPDLLAVVRSTGAAAHRVLAFRGYVRLGRESDASPEAKLKMFATALDLAQSVDDKRLVLGALGDVHTIEALELAGQYVTEAQLADEASAAAVKIAAALDAQHKAEIGKVLQQVVKSATAKPVLDGAKEQLQRLGIKP